MDERELDKSAVETVAAQLVARFKACDTARRPEEERWMGNLRHYKGFYSAKELKAMAEIPGARSRVFVRLTKIKVRTYTSRMMGLLFPANSEKNWQISTTPLPEPGPAYDAWFSQALDVMTAQAAEQVGLPPELASPVKVQALNNDIMARGDALEMQEFLTQLQAVAQLRAKVEANLTPEQQRETAREFADKACALMEQEMADQLAEVQFREIAKAVIHQGNLFGTGLLKAPMVARVERPLRVRVGGVWQTQKVAVERPHFERVSCWDFYPDPEARSLDECGIMFQYHALNKQQLYELAAGGLFDSAKIVAHVQAHPDGDTQARTFESELAALNSDGSDDDDKHTRRTGKHFRLLECWVPLTDADVAQLRPAANGQAIAPEQAAEEVATARRWVNVWLLGEQCVRIDHSPLGEDFPTPYHAYYFDKDDANFWGEGVADEIAQEVTGFNAALRMTLDNAQASIGGIWEINTASLDPGEAAKPPVPGQVYKKNSSGQAVHSHQIQSRIAETSGVMKLFEDLVHESTLPAYMHADASVGGAGRTASGLSMLMGAANIQITDQVANWDEGVTKPAVRALYEWNMRYSPREDIKGDFQVVATGSTSLVAKEVRSNQLMALLAQSGNPMDQIYFHRRELWAEVLKAQDLSDLKILRTADEVDELQALQAQVQQHAEMAQQALALLERARELAPGVMEDIANELDALQAQAAPQESVDA